MVRLGLRPLLLASFPRFYPMRALTHLFALRCSVPAYRLYLEFARLVSPDRDSGEMVRP
jgi:hypothetical protein